MDCDLDCGLHVRLDAASVLIDCSEEHPVPAVVGQVFKRLIPMESKAIANRCHAIEFSIDNRKLIFFKAVEEVMPVFPGNRIVVHEFGPTSGCNVIRLLAVVGEIGWRDDSEKINIHVPDETSVQQFVIPRGSVTFVRFVSCKCKWTFRVLLVKFGIYPCKTHGG